MDRPLNRKVHSVAPAPRGGAPAGFITALLLGFSPATGLGAAGTPDAAGRVSEAAPDTPDPVAVRAWQERVEQIARGTARLKGELAAREAALGTLAHRPSMESCFAASLAARQVQAAWNDLRMQYEALQAAATSWPDRQAQAREAARTCRLGRDAALEHSLALAVRCPAVSSVQSQTAPPPEAPIVLCGPDAGFEAEGGVLFQAPQASGSDVEAGLQAARLVAASLERPPDLVIVRRLGTEAGGERRATALPLGASGAPAETWTGGRSGPRGIVVLSGPGALSDFPLSRALSEALGGPPEPGLPQPGDTRALSAEAVARLGALSALLLVESQARLSPAERTRQRTEWLAFAAPGPDPRLDRLNLYEASGGRVRLAQVSIQPRPRGCAPGGPDLP